MLRKTTIDPRDTAIIHAIDPSYQPIQRYPGSFQVYRVVSNSDLYLVKFFRPRSGRCEDLLKREVEMLQASKKLSGTPNLIDSGVLDEGVEYLVREFISGQIVPDAGVQDSDLQRQLSQTVEWFHDAGIVDLDLNRKNVVLNFHERKAVMVDLDSCRLTTELYPHSERYFNLDKNNLDLLFKPKQR
jgi:serine/threonine protein kinase